MQFRPVGTEASCISARPIPLDMAAAAAHHHQQLWLLPSHCKDSSRLCCHGAIGMCRGRECGNQQPSQVISSFLHVQHAVDAIGT